jgi:hypothetical protein
VSGVADSSLVSISSKRQSGYFFRHYGYRLYLHPADGTAPNPHIFGIDATFRMVPGLADAEGVSFESLNYPGHYIRHRNSELWLDPLAQSDDQELFRNDATFIRD